MMQGIPRRGRDLVPEGEGQPHLAYSLSSTRSLPVRGRVGGWAAWEELASLADADANEGNGRQLAASQFPPAVRGQGRQQAAPAVFARTLYSDLESSRSENARTFYPAQPKAAWSEQQPLRSHDGAPAQPPGVSGASFEEEGRFGVHQSSSRRAAEPVPLHPAQDALGGGAEGHAWAGPRSGHYGLSGGHTSQRSAHNFSLHVHGGHQRAASPANRAPSPQLRAAVHTNQVAMAQGTEDFLSASQGFLREYNRLARLGLAQGNLRIAEDNLKEAMELVQQGEMASTEVAAVTYNLLGCMYRRMGHLDEAVDYLHRSLDVLALRKHAGAQLIERDVDLADVHMNMSSAQSALNRHDAALLHVETAIALLSDRLGLGDGFGLDASLSSEQDSKDMRMLAIAHYNRGAEMRTLNQHDGSLGAFETAMQIADRYLPPGDSLRAMVKKAYRRAGGGHASVGGDQRGAPPGVTPLRLSMLQPSMQASVQQASVGVGDAPSHRSASSKDTKRTPRSGRSQLTPQGWHNLHAVHRGNFASSARRSVRESGMADEANRQARVGFASTQVQTGLVASPEAREAPDALAVLPPRNVFQRKPPTGVSNGTGQASLDENDEVLSMAQEHDIFSLIRAVPDAHVVGVASRYVPPGGAGKGLLDYGRSLGQSLVPKRDVCESGTQVEHEYVGGSAETAAGDALEKGYLVRLKSLPGGWRRENVEQTVEEMVSQHAREEIRGRGSERGALTSGAGRAEAVGASIGRPPASGGSLDRTYRIHLQRTREAHLRYNRVAQVVQLAYRCHLARRVTIELQRNPRHLKAMLAKQIHAFASLLQSNIRCMLAKRHVAKQAARRIISAEDRWRSRRNRASLVIQAWFSDVVGSRLVARRHAGPPAAAACIQRAVRCHVARRIAEEKQADMVHRILHECQEMEASSLATIQRSWRRFVARRRLASVSEEYRLLREEPGVQCLWRGAAETLSGPQLRIALMQQKWAVVSLQQRVLSCLQHNEWLERGRRVLLDMRFVEATRIQCSWRNRVARRLAISAIRQNDLENSRNQVEAAAAVIQRAMLGKWARHRLRTLHRREMSKVLFAAATDVQRVWCGHAARNWVRSKLRLAELERYNEERHHAMALRLQLGMRCCWARRVVTDCYWEAKSQKACMRIQRASRVWLARNEFQVHVFEEVQRRKTSAVLALQAFAFSNASIRQRPRARFWRTRREASASILAAVYKAHLVRLDLQDLRFERYQERCATALQRVFRAHQARVVARQRLQVVAREYQRSAAVRLQTAMRSKWARISMQRTHEMHMETYRLRHEAEWLRKIQSSRALQAAVRSYLAREFVLRPERAVRQRASTELICRVYRGHVGRLLAQRRWYEREVDAAMLLQTAYRVHLARLLLRRTVEHNRLARILEGEQRQEAAAALIQRAYLMHVSRLIVEDRAADVMASVVRRAVARRHYGKQLAASTLTAVARRHVCLTTLRTMLAKDIIVAAVRRNFMRRRCRRKLAARNLTAAALAALIRQSYACKLAADTISASAAAFFVRNQDRRQAAAGRYLGTRVKCSFARQEYRREFASVRLQSVVRGHMDREWTRAFEPELREHRHMLRCIVKLQATQRGHMKRAAVGAVRDAMEKLEASRQLQASARSAASSSRYARHLTEMHRTKWAIVLQRYWRGALGRHRRKQLAELKFLSLAALQVQRVVRGHKGRLMTTDRIIELEQVRCAIMIQAWYRGFLGKAKAEAVRDLNAMAAAATVIAAGARGMAGRAKARHLRQLRVMERSAVKIQSLARGVAGREKAERRRAQVAMEMEYRQQMAITIQSCFRQHLAKAAFLEAVEQREALEFFKGFCSDILQCSVRSFNARNRVRRRRDAAVIITALGRGWLARRKAHKRREVLDKQHLYVAPHKLRPELYQVPKGLDLRRPAPKPKVRKFRAEAAATLLAQQPSPVPWHERQKQAVIDFQSKPQIKAFFSNLQLREHAKGRARTKAGAKPAAPAKPQAAAEKMTAGATAVKVLESSPEKPPRPASAHPQQRVQGPAPVAVPRPASAFPANAGRLQPPSASKGRVPPRFQKVRQGKAGAPADSGAESAGSGKKPKARNQRPRARGSDSERNSDDENAPPPPTLLQTGPAPPAHSHAPSTPQPAAPPATMAARVTPPMPTQPPRAMYNKDDISSDPPSDETAKRKNVAREKEKKRDVTRDKDKGAQAVSPPVKPAPPKSDQDAKIEAAFNHCRLGKYREVEKALDDGVPVDARFGENNNTMLLVCAQNGQKRIAKLLLRNFATMNTQNDKGDTAMHLCYKFNYKELGEYLKSKGADDTIRNARGQTCYEAKK